MKIWKLSDNRGYYLAHEEELAKMFCEIYGGTYSEAEMYSPDDQPAADEETFSPDYEE